MRIVKITQWLIFCSMLGWLSASWAESTTSTPAQELSTKLANVHTMQANFTQTLQSEQGTVVQKTTGQMYLQRPGKFRWQTAKPAQLLIADGRDLWIYDAGLQQVTQQRLNNQKVLSPAQLLSGRISDLQGQFVITRLNEPGQGVSFVLIPKSHNSMFQQVRLNFINDQLRALRFADNLGQTNLFQFSQVRTNLPLAPSLFRLSVPKGVDVVKQ